MGKYDDIMNIRYPSPEIEKDFPDRVLRAAQFAPFAALTGYDEAVAETARITDIKIDLDESVKEELNRKLSWFMDNLNGMPEASLTYFVPDRRKDGGRYVTKIGRIRNIRAYERDVVFEDGKSVLFSDILNIESEMFWDESAFVN